MHIKINQIAVPVTTAKGGHARWRHVMRQRHAACIARTRHNVNCRRSGLKFGKTKQNLFVRVNKIKKAFKRIIISALPRISDYLKQHLSRI